MEESANGQFSVTADEIPAHRPGTVSHLNFRVSYIFLSLFSVLQTPTVSLTLIFTSPKLIFLFLILFLEALQFFHSGITSTLTSSLINFRIKMSFLHSTVSIEKCGKSLIGKREMNGNPIWSNNKISEHRPAPRSTTSLFCLLNSSSLLQQGACPNSLLQDVKIFHRVLYALWIHTVVGMQSTRNVHWKLKQTRNQSDGFPVHGLEEFLQNALPSRNSLLNMFILVMESKWSEQEAE